MFADVQYVTNELAKQLPQNPTTDPIYFEVDEGKVIMPEILLGHTADHENNVEDGVDDEEEDLNQSKTRFDWRNSLTRVCSTFWRTRRMLPPKISPSIKKNFGQM